ncbi:MAG TPA: cysteine-rich CWC family protein [Noviherbaspirillum sp.]|jgi:hypothetical protein|uniref:cysteine-rich CWC family protein n=1 Tax=Noviherbaspirillum sp. TaxID=1926288 RepID=UPI002F92D1E1
MSTCERCGAHFECGMADGARGPCWCTGLPALPPAAYVRQQDGEARCFCPACLQTLLDMQADTCRPDK